MRLHEDNENDKPSTLMERLGAQSVGVKLALVMLFVALIAGAVMSLPVVMENAKARVAAERTAVIQSESAIDKKVGGSDDSTLQWIQIGLLGAIAVGTVTYVARQR